MGREIRRVPPGWEHPRNESGNFIPLLDEDYHTAATKWVAGFLAWEVGADPHRREYECRYYWELNGSPPEEENHRQKWDVEPTWVQMYETVTEGTPTTPAFETKEELIEYLVAHGEDKGMGMGSWRREAAESFVNAGYAPSLIVSAGRLLLPKDQDLVMP